MVPRYSRRCPRARAGSRPFLTEAANRLSGSRLQALYGQASRLDRRSAEARIQFLPTKRPLRSGAEEKIQAQETYGVGVVIVRGMLANSTINQLSTADGPACPQDPISHILKVSNQGGFRYRGSLDSLDLVALVSSLNDPDWPDTIDRESGTFIYFGDNKRPGRGLHETLRFGNELLRRFFEHAHFGSTDRDKIPPILVFAKTGEWRDVRFLGLAVPGGADIENYDDLVAIWRTTKGLRFQNYRARFTILDVPRISRGWLDSLAAGTKSHDLAPAPWEKGRYRPLKSVRSIEHRSKAEQLPVTVEDRAMISTIHAFFADRPHDFERCAAALARMMLPDIVTMDLTRPSRDGGRDGIGKLNIGRGASAVLVDFALEAIDRRAHCADVHNSSQEHHGMARPLVRTS
jgi:hypothetical protein